MMKLSSLEKDVKDIKVVYCALKCRLYISHPRRTCVPTLVLDKVVVLICLLYRWLFYVTSEIWLVFVHPVKWDIRAVVEFVCVG